MTNDATINYGLTISFPLFLLIFPFFLKNDACETGKEGPMARTNRVGLGVCVCVCVFGFMTLSTIIHNVSSTYIPRSVRAQERGKDWERRYILIQCPAHK